MNMATDAREVADNFFHHNIHVELLINQYSDLKIIFNGIDIEYYSELINSEVDKFDFKNDYISTYVKICFVYPYKDIKIDCNKCDGFIRVNSFPSKIPLIMVHEVNYAKEFIWYSLNYEEYLKTHNFNALTLSTCQLYLIKDLDEKKKSSCKVDITYLNLGLKRLLPLI